MYYCYIKKLVSLLQYIGQIYQDNNTLASLKLWKLFGAFQALLGIYKKTFFKYPPGWRFCGIWQDNGYIQKKHVQIPWSAWIFYKISHSAGYRAQVFLYIPRRLMKSRQLPICGTKPCLRPQQVNYIAGISTPRACALEVALRGQ